MPDRGKFCEKTPMNVHCFGSVSPTAIVLLRPSGISWKPIALEVLPNIPANVPGEIPSALLPLVPKLKP